MRSLGQHAGKHSQSSVQRSPRPNPDLELATPTSSIKGVAITPHIVKVDAMIEQVGRTRLTRQLVNQACQVTMPTKQCHFDVLVSFLII